MNAPDTASALRLGTSSALMVALASVSLAGVLYSPPAAAAQAQNVDRVVLVTIDTLRADHVGAYGYFLDTTPFIDSLAERGVLFEHAFAPCSSTGPSHASMFTGLYPIQHGARRNGFKLPDDTVTLAEVLKQHGFRTGGFVSAGVIARSTGTGAGFETYGDPEVRYRAVHYQTADVTTERAIGWLDERQPHEKFFLWVHYFDVHAPRVPPPAHLHAVSPRTDREFQAFAEKLESLHASEVRDRLDLESVVAYDGELRFVDAQVRRLYRHAQRDAQPTLWVVTSDHGEGLLNHGFAGHATEIFNEHLRVPLIFHWTADDGPSARVGERLVELVDIAPTVADFAGAPWRRALPNIEGRSLRPLMSSQRPAPPRVERLAFAQVGGERDRCEDKFALQSLQHKLLTTLVPGEDRFFATASDRFETSDLAMWSLQPQLRMRSRLTALLQRIVLPASGYDLQHRVVEPKMRRDLRALGYLQ